MKPEAYAQLFEKHVTRPARLELTPEQIYYARLWDRVILFPSRNSGLGLRLAEAAGAALAVVSFDEW